MPRSNCYLSSTAYRPHMHLVCVESGLHKKKKITITRMYVRGMRTQPAHDAGDHPILRHRHPHDLDATPVATEERPRLRIARVSTVSRERERVKRGVRRVEKSRTRFDLVHRDLSIQRER